MLVKFSYVISVMFAQTNVKRYGNGSCEINIVSDFLLQAIFFDLILYIILHCNWN